MQLKIDEGFKRQLMPLSPVEFSMLEESLLRGWDSSKGKIVTWNGVIVDGHNRYEICTRHSIQFEATEIAFADRNDAQDYIDRNQAGRRNCSPEDYKILTGRIYNRREKRKGERNDLTCPQFEDRLRTSDIVGKEFGLSGATIERNAIRAEVYDDLADESPELASEAKRWPQRDIEEIALKTTDEGKKERTTKDERLRAAAELRAAKSTHVSQNTGMPEWYTPARFIEAARSAMGSIDLDPASSVIAQETVRAKVFYTIEDDGLANEWTGNVWLNPPYTAGLVDLFIEKLVTAFHSGDVIQACVLVNNATETKWFQFLASTASAICFPASRIRFLDPEGNLGAPLQGQAILYLGTSMDSFTEEHKELGVVLERV